MARMPRLMPDTVFAGDYRIVELLGIGAMAAVYLAEQLSTGTRRALKVMAADSLADPKGAERFEREARASGSIASDHVVRVAAAGSDESTGLLWIAMEYLPGCSLPRFLAENPVPDPLVIREIIEQLFHAIAAAHDAGIVHRDLKPENIFVAEARRQGIAHDVKVLDFGIAKMLRAIDNKATAEGLGTPLWTAPEQARAGAEITPAADVWALGLIVFRLLTGKIYWKHMAASSSAVDLAREIVEAPLERASRRATELGSRLALPPAFDSWFAKAVTRKPTKRFQHAREAHTALMKVLGQMPVFDRRRLRRARPLRPSVIALVIIALVAAAGLWWLLGR